MLPRKAGRVPAPPAFSIVSPQDEAAIAAGCYFDLKAATHVWNFFHRFIRHSVGSASGKPFIPLEWQWQNIIAPIFGWKRADGTRRYREAYIEVPKKQGKSTTCAAIALYLLTADGEPAAEVYSAAADREQASIVYNEAVRMVEASPHLVTRLQPVPSRKELRFPKTKSMYRVLSSEAHTKEGYNIHGLIFDEFHAQPDAELYDTLKYGGASRTQPLFVYITTAGYDRESVCWAKHCYAERVISGESDDWEFYGYIATIKPGQDWRSEEAWKSANPSYGVTIQPDHFARMAKVAQESPLEENTFKRYHLNMWTEQSVRWVPIEKWDKGGVEVTPPIEKHEVCYAGLDLAATRDLNAFVMWFPDRRLVVPHFWVPRSALRERLNQKRQRLDRWVSEGYITVTEGDAADYDHIEKDILDLAATHNIQVLGIDKWNSLQISNHLMDEGLDIRAVGQNYYGLNGPMKLLERMVVREVIHHDKNPVMRWMFGNVVVKQDPSGNIKPDKSKAADKIDGVAALLSAFAVWAEAEGDMSYYENLGEKHEVVSEDTADRSTNGDQSGGDAAA